MKHGALLRLFDHMPIDAHISPLMKQNSDKRQILIHLGWPIGQQFNAGICKNVYLNTYLKLQHPFIDNIAGAMLNKIDINSANGHIRNDPYRQIYWVLLMITCI